MKTVGKKSSPNPNPLDLKLADARPETEPLPSLIASVVSPSRPVTSAPVFAKEADGLVSAILSELLGVR